MQIIRKDNYRKPFEIQQRKFWTQNEGWKAISEGSQVVLQTHWPNIWAAIWWTFKNVNKSLLPAQINFVEPKA